MGCPIELFVSPRMLLIELDSIFCAVEGLSQAQKARTHVHFENPVVVVTLKLEAAKKP